MSAKWDVQISGAYRCDCGARAISLLLLTENGRVVLKEVPLLCENPYHARACDIAVASAAIRANAPRSQYRKLFLKMLAFFIPEVAEGEENEQERGVGVN